MSEVNEPKLAGKEELGARLSVMQPYLFPYIGYYQLIHSADRFVIYDDVSFIKQGWINRNRVLVNGAPWRFTVPLVGLSSHALIKDVEIDARVFPHWREKFIKTLKQSYAKAPNYACTIDLVDRILDPKATHIAQLASDSLTILMKALSIETEFIPSSTRYNNADLRSQARILDICAREGAAHYINAQGGKELYQSAAFEAKGIQLSFIEPKLEPYFQGGGEFTAGLSIIDVLMFNSLERVRIMLNDFIVD